MNLYMNERMNICLEVKNIERKSQSTATSHMDKEYKSIKGKKEGRRERGAKRKFVAKLFLI